MPRYKLSSAMRESYPIEAKTDRGAWNKLRKNYLWKEKDGTISGCYIWMWKEMETTIDINNEEVYVEMHNKKYGPSPIGYGGPNAELLEVGKPHKITYWMPVLEGCTNHPYNVIKRKKK